ncbi:MAG: 5'/3'-nucleotidase SurE [Polyangiaceae bacterium]|nr:5'/3'-nucleotidase SurE [Polyangiaceae bacterium]MCE7894677.1 5'/3'-nucleotidase SurE [Sorangiineae bacterium PRO1]MCL4748688.1 5'/3'-nucleotidase SurE [Myxococcales bacterium]
MTERPLVLLSNDDGYRSRGISALRDALSEIADVVVCAPEVEQSASSHALSLHRPLRLFRHEPGVFSVDGTPADCVYVALAAGERVLPRKPDAVVSGLNHGLNLGDDVFYSGTVAAAREGALKGLPALAVSAGAGADFAAAAALSARLLEALLAEHRGRAVLLNANFPAGASWPVRATRLGRREYEESIEFRRDPRGREYLWIGGPLREHRPVPGSDTEAFDQGAVGVTPLVLDLWGRETHAEAESVVERTGAN